METAKSEQMRVSYIKNPFKITGPYNMLQYKTVICDMAFALYWLLRSIGGF